MVSVYIDNLIFLGNDETMFKKLETPVKQEFLISMKMHKQSYTFCEFSFDIKLTFSNYMSIFNSNINLLLIYFNYIL